MHVGETQAAAPRVRRIILGQETNVTTVSEALALAKAKHSAGRLREAEQFYREVLQADPVNIEALYLLGVVCHVLGKPMDAIACLEQVARLRPDFAEAHNLLGVVLAQQGRLDEAVACHRTALVHAPNDVEVNGNLGNLLKQQGKLDEASVCFRRILELVPNSAEAHNVLGAICQRQQKLTEAIDHYRRAVEIRPDYAHAHNNLGSLLAQENKLDEALACYQRALEIKPDLAEVHYNMGLAMGKQNRPYEAMACYRRALALNLCYAAAHNSLGRALAELGKLDDAIACYRQAIAIEPNNLEADNNLAVALANRNRMHEPKAWHRLAELFSSLQAAEKQVHSQNGEDGVIEALFAELGTTNRFFVEFGCDDGRECNAAYLLERGWSGLLMDGEGISSNPLCPVRQEFVTAENINDLFRKHKVPAEFDLLSIDIDGNDFWVWKQITARPRVVVIEYNANIPPNERRAIAYSPRFHWNGTDYFGASLLAMKELGQRKRYTLVYCERTGTNAFFVANELLPDGFESPRIEEIYRLPNIFRQGSRHPRDTTRTMIDPFADAP